MEIEKKESLIVFTPSGHRDYFENDITLLEAARALGVDLDSVCGGRGTVSYTHLTLPTILLV